MKKGQSALEYMSTYVWAFIIISITIGALYYFGVLDFSKYLPQSCEFGTQLKCSDFSLTPTIVKFKLINNLGEDLKINDFLITDDSGGSLACNKPPVGILWKDATEQNFAFTSCSGGLYVPGNRISLRIGVEYYSENTPSQPKHWVYGSINAKINPS